MIKGFNEERHAELLGKFKKVQEHNFWTGTSVIIKITDLIKIKVGLRKNDRWFYPRLEVSVEIKSSPDSTKSFSPDYESRIYWLNMYNYDIVNSMYIELLRKSVNSCIRNRKDMQSWLDLKQSEADEICETLNRLKKEIKRLEADDEL